MTLVSAHFWLILDAIMQPEDVGRTVALGFLPLHHTFGFGFIVLRAALAPVTYVIMPKWNADLALDLIVKCARALRGFPRAQC